MLAYTYHFVFALLANCILESVTVVVLVRWMCGKGQESISINKLIATCIFANMLTLPYVWYVFPYIFYQSYTVALCIGELFAFLLEAAFYAFYLGLSVRQALIVSFCANALSFLVVSYAIQLIFAGR